MIEFDTCLSDIPTFQHMMAFKQIWRNYCWPCLFKLWELSSSQPRATCRSVVYSVRCFFNFRRKWRVPPTRRPSTWGLPKSLFSIGGAFFWGINFFLFWELFFFPFAFAFAAFAFAFAFRFGAFTFDAFAFGAFSFAAFAFDAFAFAAFAFGAFAFAAFASASAFAFVSASAFAAFAFASATFCSFSVFLLLCCIGLSFCFYIYFVAVAA